MVLISICKLYAIYTSLQKSVCRNITLRAVGPEGYISANILSQVYVVYNLKNQFIYDIDIL